MDLCCMKECTAQYCVISREHRPHILTCFECIVSEIENFSRATFSATSVKCGKSWQAITLPAIHVSQAAATPVSAQA